MKSFQPSSPRSRYPLRSLLMLFYLTVFGLSLYGVVLNGEFIGDDYIFLAYNTAIRHFPDVTPVWKAFPTRFLVFSSFAVNYWLHGFRVFGFHLVNILIHILNSFLTFQFVLLLGETPAGQKLTARPFSAVSFWAALIFLCHPLQTQGVSYIFQRAVSMATFFYLLTIVFYLQARLKHSRIKTIFALGSYVCAIFCKEMVVTLPAALLLCEVFFFEPRRREWKEITLRIFPFILISGLLVTIFLNIKNEEAGLSLNQQVAASSFHWNFFLTEMNVLVTYIRLMFLPVVQRFDYDYPVVLSLGDVRPWLSLGLLSALLGLAVCFFRKKRLMSFCVFWFFLTTSVELIVVSVVHRALLFEHWLYLPMVGFSIFLACLLFDVAKDEAHYKRLGFIIIFCLSLMTLMRNQIWRNELIFWEYETRLSPGKASVFYAAGVAYDRRNMKDSALLHYLKAVELDERRNARLKLDRESLAKIYNNIGIIYARRAEPAKALENFQKALSLNPLQGMVENNIGTFYYYQGDYGKAVDYLSRSLEVQPDNPETLEYLGRSLLVQDRAGQAREVLMKSRELFLAQDKAGEAGDIDEVLDSMNENESKGDPGHNR